MDKTAQKEMIFGLLRNYCTNGEVYRKKIDKITGGLLQPGTMANRDLSGTGIEKRTIVRGKVIYPVEDLIKWLIENATLINFDD